MVRTKAKPGPIRAEAEQVLAIQQRESSATNRQDTQSVVLPSAQDLN
jgi:hypothetical protein